VIEDKEIFYALACKPNKWSRQQEEGLRGGPVWGSKDSEREDKDEHKHGNDGKETKCSYRRVNQVETGAAEEHKNWIRCSILIRRSTDCAIPLTGLSSQSVSKAQNSPGYSIYS
jgi:hypothetical protein